MLRDALRKPLCQANARDQTASDPAGQTEKRQIYPLSTVLMTRLIVSNHTTKEKIRRNRGQTERSPVSRANPVVFSPQLSVDSTDSRSWTGTMEVHFTPEQEAQLSQIASHAGTDTARLVKDAALRLLEQDARFRAAVREGIAQADRGEFIEEEEMEARIERMLNF
jgi:predicted transcriptional regulator